MFKTCFFIYLALFCAQSSWSQSLFEQNFWRETGDLSAGERRIGFSLSMAAEASSYEKSSLSPSQKLSLRGKSLKAKSLGLQAKTMLAKEAVVAEQELEFQTNRFEFSPMLSFGVTERWDVGVKLPLVRTSVSLSSSVKYSPEFEQKLKKSSLSEKARQNLRKEIVEQFNQGLRDNQFDEIDASQFSKFSMGDIELQSRYQLYAQPDISWEFTQLFRLPTGQRQKYYELVDLSSGDGQVDIGIGSRLMMNALPRLQFLVEIMHTVQIEDKSDMRMDLGGSARAESEWYRGLKRDLGDISEIYLQGRLTVWENFKLLMGYSYAHKTKDEYKYSGNKFKTDKIEDKQVAQLGVDYSVDRRRVYKLTFNMYALMSSQSPSENTASELNLNFNF